jgi:Ala-tRNA(Pro) deacylase
MPTTQLKKFLDSNQVKYVTIRHSPSYTAQEVAESAHVPGNTMAKTVIVKLDGTMAMVVEPASHKVNFDLLKKHAGAKDVELASEREFQQRFPECELGAMPPFGNLYGMSVYVADSLSSDREIIFNAGTHSELIKMAYEDFARLVSPKVISL